MTSYAAPAPAAERSTALDISREEFRALGYRLVDQIADHLATLGDHPVTPGESVAAIRTALGRSALPEDGSAAGQALERAAGLLFKHSLHIAHPRFLGYVTAGPAPIAILGELLAAGVNPNVGAWQLSPVATEIEIQTVRWIAELLGYPATCGGLLVSGGNMANFVGFLAARRAKAAWDVRSKGVAGENCRRLRLYTSSETHTWVQKAADLFGLGTDAIRWIPADKHYRIDTAILRRTIAEDAERGDLPFLVVGSAGTVVVGAVDPLPELAGICREHGLWLHVDGAYGGFAAALPEASADLKGLALADSVAVDPHKWLYQPLEAGCALVRDAALLRDTFSFHPAYYKFEAGGGEEPTNYYEYGMQNSRGFRALKVWLSLQQAGRRGYQRLIAEDIELARYFYELIAGRADMQRFTQNLSIATFRYAPADLGRGSEAAEAYLNELNTKLLENLQAGGEAFISNGVLGKTFVLRMCSVNFRTTRRDVAALVEIVARLGAEIDRALRPPELRGPA